MYWVAGLRLVVYSERWWGKGGSCGVAKFLHLPVTETTPLRVLVGNGSVLDCHQVCPTTPLLLQGHSFLVSLHLLLISGADVVLGIAWLKGLGPVITDYTALTMQFTHLGLPVTLKADVSFGLTPISAPH